jgi:hypothetical protein
VSGLSSASGGGYRLPAEFESAVLAEIERRKPPRKADVFNV